MKPDDFIAAISPAAVQAMPGTGVPASFVIAQGALESAWGKAALATDACNLFGVKADSSWRGPTITLPTREFLKGEWVTVPAVWRKYPTWYDCIVDHAAYLRKNPRYKPAFAGGLDGAAFARAVAAAGYATDPKYADKVIATMHSHNLERFDKI